MGKAHQLTIRIHYVYVALNRRTASIGILRAGVEIEAFSRSGVQFAVVLDWIKPTFEKGKYRVGLYAPVVHFIRRFIVWIGSGAVPIERVYSPFKAFARGRLLSGGSTPEKRTGA